MQNENKIPHCREQFNRKLQKENKLVPITPAFIHDSSSSFIDKDTSMKSGGVKSTLEETNGTIKNRQSSDTDSNGHIRTQSKKKTKHRKLNNEQSRPHQKLGMNPGAREGY
jgi:hypothetical protein